MPVVCVVCQNSSVGLQKIFLHIDFDCANWKALVCPQLALPFGFQKSMGADTLRSSTEAAQTDNFLKLVQQSLQYFLDTPPEAIRLSARDLYS